MFGMMTDDLGGDAILRTELEGLLKIEAGEEKEGLRMLSEAAEAEAAFPFMFGPPNIVKPTFELLGEELIEFTRQHVAHYKCPKSVDFVTDLPRLPTGKFQRRIVREPYWAGHEKSI